MNEVSKYEAAYKEARALTVRRVALSRKTNKKILIAIFYSASFTLAFFAGYIGTFLLFTK